VISLIPKKDKEGNILESPIDLSDDDIISAMRNMNGFIDISINDFKEIYKYAYSHALKRSLHAITAKELMTTDVSSVASDATIQTVIQEMAARIISGVPVLSVVDQKVVGIISEKDILFHIGKQNIGSLWQLLSLCFKTEGSLDSSVLSRTATALMSSPAITINKETSAAEIIRLFQENKINRVPVVDSSQQLLGIVSRNDLLNAHLLLNE
jgi:CBS-domain-containing membrane protein